MQHLVGFATGSDIRCYGHDAAPIAAIDARICPAALYGYRGFFKSPDGLSDAPPARGFPAPYHPALSVYGASLRGGSLGGVVWVEGAWYDSRRDRVMKPDFLSHPKREASRSVDGVVGISDNILQRHLQNRFFPNARSAVIGNPFAGALAMIMFSLAIQAKLLSETVDAIDIGPLEAGGLLVHDTPR